MSLDLLRATAGRVDVDLQSLRTLSRENAATEIAAEDVPKLLHSLWDVPPLSLQMSAYEEIQDSGRLRLVSNPELRRSMAHFRQMYEFARQAYVDAFQHQH